MFLHGLLLFLFIPLVLALFLRQPLGPGWSVAVGIALMVGHRFVAAPWMDKFADVRCLWCGRVGSGIPVSVEAGGRLRAMNACSAPHAALIARFLAFVQEHRVVIAAGIFAPLAWLLASSLAIAAGHPILPHEANALIFRLVVAVTVVGSATFPFLAPKFTSTQQVPDRDRLRCPFPLHNLFLLGIRNTLWVFRVVGAWWIVDGLARLMT